MNHEQSPQKNAKRDFLQSLQRTFESDDGAIILAWLHATAGTRKPCFLRARTGSAIDPLAAAVRDGRCGLVWEIEAALTLARSGGSEKPTARRTSRLGNAGV